MSPRTRLFVAIVSTGVISYLAVGSLLGRVLGDTTYGQLAVFNEVVRLIVDGYVEPIELGPTMGGAHRGLLEALDGDSAYLDAEAYLAYREGETSPADVGVSLSRRYGFLMVVGVRVGSTAAEAGLRPGDILKTIDGDHTRPLSVFEGERRLAGEPGSSVRIELLRAGVDPEEIELRREVVQPVAPSSRMLDGGIGYLEVSEFDAGTADLVRTELEVLRRGGAGRLVLDLRRAGFGDPELGVELARLFVREGVLSRRAGRKVPEQVWQAEPDRVAWSEPVAVLIDAGTSSGGEVAAAALAAAGAELVGRPSFGRAGVQKALPLPEGGLLLTVAKYLRPDGTAIHGEGLQPGIPVRRSAAGGEEEGDPVLDAAVEHLASLDASVPAA